MIPWKKNRIFDASPAPCDAIPVLSGSMVASKWADSGLPLISEDLIRSAKSNITKLKIASRNAYTYLINFNMLLLLTSSNQRINEPIKKNKNTNRIKPDKSISCAEQGEISEKNNQLDDPVL